MFNFLGFDMRKIIALKNIPKFIKNYLEWKNKKGPISSFFPILSDLDDFAGVASGHYFHQDLLEWICLIIGFIQKLILNLRTSILMVLTLFMNIHME